MVNATRLVDGRIVETTRKVGSIPITSNYLAMSEALLTMPETLNLKDIDVYALFTDEEKEKVNEIIAEAFARNYGVIELQDFDYDIKGEIL